MAIAYYERKYYQKHAERIRAYERERRRNLTPEDKDKRQLTRDRLKKQRREWFAMVKHNAGCKMCGTRDFRCLDFHHRDSGTKSFCIGSNVCTKYEKIRDEMDKCDVLCSNCHRILTYEEYHSESHSNKSENPFSERDGCQSILPEASELTRSFDFLALSDRSVDISTVGPPGEKDC